MAKKRRAAPLAPALEAQVPALAKLLGCPPSAVRDALRGLMRVGLVTTRGDEIVLSLATAHGEGGREN